MNKFNFEGKKVLVVEDNILNIEIVCAILSMVKVTYDAALNGKEAMERFNDSEEAYYSAILTDIQMPIMDGNNMVKNIRELHRKDAKSIPIIAMTAFDEKEKSANDTKNLFNEQITKPIDPEILFNLLVKYL